MKRRLLWLLLTAMASAQYVATVPATPVASSGFTSPVQTCTHHQAAATTEAITLAASGGTCTGSNVVANDHVWLFGSHSGTAGTVTAADNASPSSNTYTCHDAGGFSVCDAKISNGGGASLTITVTAGGATLVGMIATEWVHNPSSFDLIGTQDTFSAGTTWTGGALSLATTNELMFEWGGNQGTCAGSSSGIFTAGSSFTIDAATQPAGGQYGQASSDCGFEEWRVVATSGSTTASVTLSTSNSGFGAKAAWKP